MGLAAGKLDRRVRIERFVASTDPGSGEQVKVWTTLWTPSAAWRRASSNETLAAAEITAAISDVFEIRWDSSWADVNPKDRLVFEDRVYEIVSAEEIGRRVGIRIAAVARGDL